MADQKTVRIQGEEFQISQPYAEGHTISAAEAKALNQVRAENIGNNFRKRVKDSIDGVEGAESMDQVREALAKYDAEYQFTLASVGAGRQSLDPVEREAKKIARNILKDHLTKQGRSLKEVESTDEGKEKIAAKVAELMEHPDIVKAAKKTVADQQKIKDSLANISV